MKVNRVTNSLVFFILFTLGSFSIVFADDYQEGWDAYDRKDYKTTLRLWLPLAEQGEASAQYNLGHMYAKGKGVLQDHQEAVKWYRLSAEQGHAKAQFHLGLMYDDGQGVPQDYKEGVKWYRLSAEQGYAKAQYNLGVMYDKGRGVPIDYKEAVKWYRLSAEQGFDEARNNLKIVEKAKQEKLAAEKAEKEKQAFELLTKEAQGGSAEAQLNLGNMYADGLGVPQDYIEAVKLLRLAAKQGFALAQQNLGRVYGKGHWPGVLQDYKEAVRFYRLAAEQGHANAQNDLGLMYYRGYGVPQDYKEAAKWFRLAAEQGNASFQKNLAVAMKKLEKLEKLESAPKAFEAELLAMEKSRFIECDAFTVNLRGWTLFFDGTFNEPLLMKEGRVYMSVAKSRQITKQELALAGGKLNIAMEKKYGSDNKLKALEYLDQKTVECGGESKQIAAKQRSPKEEAVDLLRAAKTCRDSASGPMRRPLTSFLSTSVAFLDAGDYRTSIGASRDLLRMGRRNGISNCNE